MTSDQLTLFALLIFVFVFLIWGRWRYDLVAFVALLAGVVAGLVPYEQAFSGFGHPATVIVALVLIVSRGLSNSGAIELLTRYVVDTSRSLTAHIGILGSVAAVLSALMNNVATLALLMPIDMQVASKAKRVPALTLMPLSFATILGGMITLIGTPPNIVISEYRADALGEPYQMFDFAPVGLACAVAGLLFVTLVGWRLLPRDRVNLVSDKDQFDLAEYFAEVKVPEDSNAIGKKVRDLDEAAGESQIEILGLIREGRRMPGFARQVEVRADDVLVIEGSPDSIEDALGNLKLEYVGKGEGALEDEQLSLREVVVPEASSLAGRSAASARLMYRFGVALVGVSRGGKRFREGVRKLPVEAGDVLLLLGSEERLNDVVARLGVLPLAHRGHRVIQREKAGLAVGIFGLAIVAASVGVIALPIALGIVTVLLVVRNIVPLRELYDSVEWPVIVLLGSMIPLGGALQSTGGTQLIADGIVDLSTGLSATMILALLMIVTMTLSDVMNNVATAVIAAPIGIEIASRLQVNPDPFLMGVAVAASSAFLTPIGHKNNTLIMGPGGYRFGDYWRMGVPLEVLIIAVGVPMITWVWPM
jgi:di/tricarboxylate transporter